MEVAVIIPIYNEEKHIKECLTSLLNQDHPDLEIIVIDDGSTDKTCEILQDFSQKQQIIFLKQDHLGPGHARNLGASFAGGEILVFVDADMIFREDFVRNLVKPIVEGKTKGTFSKDEYAANWDKKIARFWSFNIRLFSLQKGKKNKILYFFETLFAPKTFKSQKMTPDGYPSHAPIFRAILKTEFQKVHGYDTEIGYTDDWTLSRKLGYESDAVENARYYHYNPDTLREVFWQSRWIGKNEFISGDLLRKIKSFVQYNLISSFIKGVLISIRIFDLNYLAFQFVYDLGVFISTMSSFFINKRIK